MRDRWQVALPGEVFLALVQKRRSLSNPIGGSRGLRADRFPQPHGDRQWRCEAEQAGRILCAQASRKQQFTLILPLLEQGMILPEPVVERLRDGAALAPTRASRSARRTGRVSRCSTSS
jgi:hypothetical protein